MRGVLCHTCEAAASARHSVLTLPINSGQLRGVRVQVGEARPASLGCCQCDICRTCVGGGAVQRPEGELGNRGVPDNRAMHRQGRILIFPFFSIFCKNVGGAVGDIEEEEEEKE